MTENDNLSRLKQCYDAVFSATVKPEHIAMDARKFAEALCCQLFTQEVGKEPDKLHTLEDYLNSFKGRKLPFAEFLKLVYHDEGPFGDHLRRIVMLISKEMNLATGVLAGKSCPDYDSFYRLRGLGVLVGDSKDKVRLRCELYARYLKEHL